MSQEDYDINFLNKMINNVIIYQGYKKEKNNNIIILRDDIKYEHKVKCYCAIMYHNDKISRQNKKISKIKDQKLKDLGLLENEKAYEVMYWLIEIIKINQNIGEENSIENILKKINDYIYDIENYQYINKILKKKEINNKSLKRILDSDLDEPKIKKIKIE